MCKMFSSSFLLVVSDLGPLVRSDFCIFGYGFLGAAQIERGKRVGVAEFLDTSENEGRLNRERVVGRERRLFCCIEVSREVLYSAFHGLFDVAS